MRKLFAHAALMTVLICVGANGAYANTLVSTTPIAGSTLKASPSAVSITTELALLDTGNEVAVTDPNGARVDDGTLSINGMNVVVGMKELTLPGVYTVTYTLLAANDVPLQGQFRFNFTAPVVSAAPSTSSSPTDQKLSGSDLGTNIFVMGLMLVAIIVFIALVLYARKLYRKR